MGARGITRASLIGFALASLVASCARTADELPAGSQSNWLTCASDATCPGAQQCACGYCTSECDSDGACGNLPGRARCAASSEVQASCGGPAPASNRVCVFECERNSDCNDAGPQGACSDGLCVVQATNAPSSSGSEAFPGSQGSGDGWELLAFTRSGPPYSAALAKDQADLERMWTTTGMQLPLPTVFDDAQGQGKVIVLLVHAVSSTCPQIQFQGLTIEEERVFGSFSFDGSPMNCTDDATSAAFVLAVDRAALSDRFTLSLTEEVSCRGCDTETVEVDLASNEPDNWVWWAASRWGIVIGGAPPEDSHVFRTIHADGEHVLAILRTDWSEPLRWVQGGGRGGMASIPERVEAFTANCLGGGDCIEDPGRIERTGELCGVDVDIPAREDGAVLITFAEDGSCEAELDLGSDGTDYRASSLEPER